jgi:SH3-like domain-containing protein/DNA-binding transcriptional ArsR family regulator
VAVELELDAEMFVALRAFSDGPPGVVSPWNGVDAATVSKALRARLADAGAIDAHGARRELRPTLAALAAATATTSLRFVGTGVLVEYLVWVSRDHAPVGLSAVGKPHCFRLQDPAPTDRVVEFIAALVGRSPLRRLDLNLDLSIADSLALAAIVDVQRRRTLSALGAGQAEVDEPVDVAQLKVALEQPPGFSLVQGIRRVCAPSASCAPRLEDSLASLLRRGLVDGDSSAVRLAGPCAELAERFAAMTNLVELANACDTGTDGVARLGFACLQAGVSDLMTIEWVERGIHIETVSADTVVGYIDRLLHRPDLAVESATAARPRVDAGSAVTESTPGQASPSSAAPTRVTSTRKPGWRPTHLVPAGGMDAWATPDRAAVPVAHIDPRVELQLLERTGEWARIRCSDGWSAWVDGRVIEKQSAGPAMSTVPGQSESFTEPGTHIGPAMPTVVTRLPWNPTSSTAVWRPTHTVPVGGIAARARPNAAEPSIVKLDAGTELEVLERRGGWAHIRCSTGWSAWVEGNAIQARGNEDRRTSR